MFGLITGTVFSDIEVKESKAGKLYSRATIKDGYAEDTVFVTVFAFDGSDAFNILRKAAKDDALAVQGRVKLRTYERDGVTKVAVDLMADNILPVKGVALATAKHIEKSREEDAKPQEASARAQKMTSEQRAEFIEDSIPF